MAFWACSQLQKSVDRWRRVLTDQPARMLDLFRIPVRSKEVNQWGDSRKDIIPAVQALHNEAQQDGADQTFKPALCLGLAELLCQYASQNPPYFDDRPSLFHELDPTIVGQALCPPYRDILRILCHVLVRGSTFERVEGSTLPCDQEWQHLILDAIKGHWRSLMQLYWQAPVGQMTEIERKLLSYLVSDILSRDISFQKTMITCEYTLPLLTRNVLDCTMSDFVSVVEGSFDPLLKLTWETSPTDSRVHSTLGPLPADVLDLMLKGSNGSFGSIVSKFSWLLSWADKHEAFTCLSVVHNIASMLQSDSSGPGASLRRECCRKFLRSEDFWRGMFRVLQMGYADLDDILDIQGLPGRTLSMGDRMCNAIYDLSRIFWNEDEVLATQDVTAVTILIKAGLFEAMEEALAAYGSRHSRPVNETRPEIFLNMMSGIVWRFAKSDPAIVLPVLRPLLPRSRISYLLLETILLRESPLPHYPQLKVKVPHLQMWYQVSVRTALNFHNQLEDLCRNGECGKRGCSKKGGAKCSRCRETSYCSADCQKLDWPEHKLICGYKNEDPTPMGGVKGGIVLPFSLRKKVQNSGGRAV